MSSRSSSGSLDVDVNGERVVVDLELSIDGTVIPLRDVFEMAGDRIAKLEITTLQFGLAEQFGHADQS